MEAIIQAKIIEAASQGNLVGAIGWLMIFSLLWVQLRGIKSEFKGIKEELHTTNKNFAKSLAEGEKRFEALESKFEKHDKRMTLIETFLRKETQI